MSKNKNMFSSITVIIDIDDTIVDLLSSLCNWLNNVHDLDVKSEDITDWDLTKSFPTLTKEQIFEPLHTDCFWETVEPKDEAVKYVKQLIDDGFDVYLCTATDYRNVKPKYEYIILKHFPFIPWQQVIVASCKQMIKADFLIDDGVHNQEGGDYIKILVSAPHNQGYDAEENGMIRSECWKFTYDTIISLAEKIS